MVISQDYKLGKKYKLCSKKTIDLIFNEGSTLKNFPFVLRYIEAKNDENAAFQLVISAPKKNFRSAVKRNRIKRICREAVRMNKSTLENYSVSNKKQLALFLIYTDNREMPVDILTQKMKKLFEKLISKIEHEESK